MASDGLKRLQLGLPSRQYRRLGGVHSTHLFLTVLDAGKSKLEVLAAPVPGEGSSWLAGRRFLAVSSRVREEGHLSPGYFHKGANPTREGSTFVAFPHLLTP